jgi:hypothetical protein
MTAMSLKNCLMKTTAARMCGLTLLMGRRKTERLFRKMVTAATFSEKAAAIRS